MRRPMTSIDFYVTKKDMAAYPTGLCEQGAPRRSDRAAIALRRKHLGFRLRNRCAIAPLKMTRGGRATFGRSDDFACAKVMIGLCPSDVPLRGVMSSLRERVFAEVRCHRGMLHLEF